MTPSGGASAAGTEVAGVAVRAGIRAPSQHNTQPWLFRVRSDAVEVLVDRGRVLRASDPEGRGADLACGAALCNMRVAVAATGRQAVVEVLPDPHDPDVAGLVRIGGARTVTPEDHALAGAVARRTTNRRPFVDRPVPRRLSSALSAAAEVEGARLLVLSPAQLDVFAELLRRADHLLAEEAEYRRELADWTHDGGRADGVPASAGGPRPEAGALLALRDFRPDERARPAAAFEQDPLVAVLTTATDTRRHRVLAGVAMERVLLAATARGLSASFLPQPLEVEDTRSRLVEALGGCPQTALRIGHGYPGVATPRRPPGDVIIGAGGE